MKEYITNSDAETMAVGLLLASNTYGGEVVCLHGDLGAGKTTLVKGMAKGYIVEEEITSPTFTLMNVYEMKHAGSKFKNLIHIDTYRLKDSQELLDIGVEDYLGQLDTVTIVEWPEKVADLLKGKKCKNIFIEHTENGRKIKIED